ncbi:hypothetical protein IWW55_004578 [Coemansia sp. RSA 2706]|nr:hypothetical protein LPJ63_002914 [Coemansia sp. RSA 2711]KAJ2298110.1 hypothetical protein IWW55_004578 [Coemansia sp. RSA 2706]KAJ2314097.1 hypothetical protein IWW54_001119 [Coemansia sp. RSA 2705]KAJ2737508.1 hypothetical protein H4R23_001785 [Coemansia sp. Cherry 401B]
MSPNTMNDSRQPDISLLSILQSVESDRLTEFLKNEHSELLALRNQAQMYERAIAELKTHLDNVFAVAGGLGALPLSDATRGILGLTNTLPGKNGALAVPEGLCTPLSLNYAKARSVSQPADTSPPLLANPNVQSPQFQHPPLPHASTFQGCNGVEEVAAPLNTHNAMMTPTSATDTHSFQQVAQPGRPTMAGEEPVETKSHSQLASLVGELRQTVGEQQSDIEDLEAALRERKTLIRALRKQLRDKELQKFAAASDHAGLRRTASIMGVPRGVLAHIAAAGPLPSAVSIKLDNKLPIIQPAGRLEAIASNESLDKSEQQDKNTSDSSTSTGLSSVENARRPSGYINGWPIYDSDRTAESEQPDTAASPTSDQEDVQSTDCKDRPPTPPAPPFAVMSSSTSSPRSVTNPLLYKESVSSGLNASVAETNNSASSSSRAPRLLRTMVSKTPRRIYSRLSNRLKKSDA